MNDYLEELQQFLIQEGFQNVYIDGFIGPLANENESASNQITIISEPGSNQIDRQVKSQQVNFALYVKNRNKQLSKQICTAIKNKLHNHYGLLTNINNPINWRIIGCITEPYFWGVSEQNENIYLSRFEAVIVNPDIQTIYG